MQPKIDASKQVNALLHIAQIAMELVQAQNVIASTKAAYYDRLGEFDDREGSIDPRCPESAAIIEFSKDAFAAYKAAKRKAYNVTRRLRTACMRAGA